MKILILSFLTFIETEKVGEVYKRKSTSNILMSHQT